MWDSLLLDFLYLASDLMTGKSVPILLAVTVYHLDPHLLGSMVLIGTCVGIACNIYKTCKKPASEPVDWYVRLFLNTLSTILSICLLKKLLWYMHPNGLMLGTISSFWVINTSLPERPVSLTIMFITTIVLFYVSLIISPAMVIDSDYVLEHQRQLQGTKYHLHATTSNVVANTRHTHPIQNSFPACIIILILTIYATVLHGPLYNYTGRLCSPSLLFNRPYAIFVCIISALFRAYVIISIGWMQHNIIHLLLEGSPSVNFAVWFYAIVTLLSINWTVTHTTYNLLTQFKENPNLMKIKYIIFLFAIAYIYNWTYYTVFLTVLTIFACISISVALVFF